jgi:pimeloyl-ACP methyl ester carboxylesterase
VAARFWRCVLGCELLVAAAIAWIWAATQHWPRSAALAIALGLFAAMQFLLVGASYLAAQCLTRGKRRFGSDIWRAWVGESLQFLRAQLAMSGVLAWRARDTDHRPAGSPARPVLLLHGILCNGAVWGRLRKRLGAAGFAPIRAPDLEPLGGDIEAWCACAQRELLAIQRQCHGAPVAIVAHSMGGLVARSLLASVAPDVISGIVTVASPHHGTVLARCLPLAGARQMRPDSRWLATLNAAQEGQLDVPLTSIYSREDSLLVPAQSAVLRGAGSRELQGLGHFGILRSPRALDAIISALSRA